MTMNTMNTVAISNKENDFISITTFIFFLQSSLLKGEEDRGV